jgi:hypothetical protein
LRALGIVPHVAEYAKETALSKNWLLASEREDPGIDQPGKPEVGGKDFWVDQRFGPSATNQITRTAASRLAVSVVRGGRQSDPFSKTTFDVKPAPESSRTRGRKGTDQSTEVTAPAQFKPRNQVISESTGIFPQLVKTGIYEGRLLAMA